MKGTSDTLVVIALDVSQLVVVISEHVQAGDMPNDIEQTVNDLA
jgi:hypothetical protein